jgi:hypothetical protein
MTRLYLVFNTKKKKGLLATFFLKNTIFLHTNIDYFYYEE